MFATNPNLSPFTIKQPKYVQKGGPHAVKAHHMRKWVEEYMTIKSANTRDECLDIIFILCGCYK